MKVNYSKRHIIAGITLQVTWVHLLDVLLVVKV